MFSTVSGVSLLGPPQSFRGEFFLRGGGGRAAEVSGGQTAASARLFHLYDKNGVNRPNYSLD